ncbi:hypothetical protein TRVL_08341 [Trypanosoma vivax]|nr:hypothetical protein TRVL_08341 [Trypanosoma vivax]
MRVGGSVVSGFLLHCSGGVFAAELPEMNTGLFVGHASVSSPPVFLKVFRPMSRNRIRRRSDGAGKPHVLQPCGATGTRLPGSPLAEESGCIFRAARQRSRMGALLGQAGPSNPSWACRPFPLHGGGSSAYLSTPFLSSLARGPPASVLFPIPPVERTRAPMGDQPAQPVATAREGL